MFVTTQTKTAQREALFCRNCALLGSAKEAATLAGYPAKSLDKTLRALLAREEIREKIAEELRALSGEAIRGLALRGLCRIAFGGVSDAVKLAYLEEAPSPGVLSGMDLFALSELRRPKSGGCEIRFYDRIKALELLLQHGGEKEREQSGFLEALLGAAEKGEDGAV